MSLNTNIASIKRTELFCPIPEDKLSIYKLKHKKNIEVYYVYKHNIKNSNIPVIYQLSMHLCIRISLNDF